MSATELGELSDSELQARFAAGKPMVGVIGLDLFELVARALETCNGWWCCLHVHQGFESEGERMSKRVVWRRVSA
jgi:hypothetical protein